MKDFEQNKSANLNAEKAVEDRFKDIETYIYNDLSKLNDLFRRKITNAMGNLETSLIELIKGYIDKINEKITVEIEEVDDPEFKPPSPRDNK